MQLVRQEHPEGCAVAVFAMLLDLTYDGAATALDFQGEGLRHGELRRALEERGCFTRVVFDRRTTGGVWPPPPFTARHYAEVVQPSGNGHVVAVEADGSVLDPLRPTPAQLTDWDVVQELVGVVQF